MANHDDIFLQNYNKSRIHSFRGAKDIEMRLDGRLVFVGEIARANGDVTGGTDSFGDVSFEQVIRLIGHK